MCGVFISSDELTRNYYCIFQKMTNLTDLEDFEVFDQEDGLIVTAYTVMSAGECSIKMKRLNLDFFPADFHPN